MSATEAALDQHLRMADKHYQEWEEYEDALEALLKLEKENGIDDERDCSNRPRVQAGINPG